MYSTCIIENFAKFRGLSGFQFFIILFCYSTCKYICLFDNILIISSVQICDFGLARVEELDESRHMTQEVVTQYYRAPEILMGSRHYSNAIDIWSVGCIFAELLGRRILFQAQSPIDFTLGFRNFPFYYRFKGKTILCTSWAYSLYCLHCFQQIQVLLKFRKLGRLQRD